MSDQADDHRRTAAAFTATVDAPDKANRGSSFDVAWTGPDGPGDYITIAPAGSQRVAAAIYGAGLCALFGGSALYHRWRWHERWRPILRRIEGRLHLHRVDHDLAQGESRSEDLDEDRAHPAARIVAILFKCCASSSLSMISGKPAVSLILTGIMLNGSLIKRLFRGG